MYKIVLKDGTSFDLKYAILEADAINLNNITRRTIELQFDNSKYGLSEIDAAFTEDNMNCFTIKDDSSESVYTGFSLLVEKGVKPYELEPATASTPAKTEMRICVTFAEFTYEESQVKQLKDTIDTLIVTALTRNGG